ncbi:MAG: hypothetical protein SVU32_04900 [Candidatus Nanohaloarchaea archaeon]|nr:hypothetical protein [Candidatus Nanohaloarchaea archaeon]
MAAESNNTDEERDRVPIPTDAEVSSPEPVLRENLDIEKMHHRFPEKYDYLQDTLKHLDVIEKKVGSMKTRQPDRSEEQVTIRQRRREPERTVTASETGSNREFERRRLKRQAIQKVKGHLLSRGFSDEFIREHEDVIEEKIEDFLED